MVSLTGHEYAPHAGNDRARLVQHTQCHRVALRRRGDLEAALVVAAVGDLQRHAVGGANLETAELCGSRRETKLGERHVGAADGLGAEKMGERVETERLIRWVKFEA